MVGDSYPTAATITPMATTKVSVTLEETAIARARRAAGPRGLSAYLDAALKSKLEADERRQALLDYLDELEASDPTPPAARRAAERRSARLRAASRAAP